MKEPCSRTVAVIKVPIDSPQKDEDPATDPRRQAASRRLPATTVDQSTPWAAAAVVILPATANCTKPGRRASLRLIVSVSHGFMAGHFHRPTASWPRTT
jgi:hypothetical protein